METKYGFTKLTIAEFESWINRIKVARTIRTVQQHHTAIPDYSLYTGNNHFTLQRNMKNYHVHKKGWRDIGQHFTSFPDGTILTGRSLEYSPACIKGFNQNSICIEHLGNFNKGEDEMTPEQASTAIRMTAAICQKFSIAINTDKIVYHHWFNLYTGRRNNGTGGNKSCPGTAFFGGNKVEDANAHFIPKVKGVLGNKPPNTAESERLKYVCVLANRLNIRTGAGTQFPKAKDRSAAILGAKLRVYAEKNGWYKISSSSEHWVSGVYTQDIQLATVTANRLNVRTGPSTRFRRTGSYKKGDELWIEEIDGGWCKVVFEEAWVSKRYLSFEE